MTLTRKLNDPRATAVSSGGRDRGHEMTSKVLEQLGDAKGAVYALGRGESDTKVTYIKLFNTGGTACYLYPNAAGNGLIVSTAKP